jgi:regulator of protease activity HflC (stomatin/prohibitin superfamily)
MYAEKPAASHSGALWLLLDAILALATAGMLIWAIVVDNPVILIPAVVTGILALVITLSFYMLQPSQAAVLMFFGDYRGTDRTPGLRIANPLYTSKVNDANGNPIEIAAVVVWRVTNTAQASFGVDEFVDYVETQSESAVRQLARTYPYDSFDDADVTTLIGDTREVNEDLQTELQERALDAGVEVIESRITDLAYAPEIADSMLRRQQAGAIVAARVKIVEGAVLMVRDAIEALEAGTEEHEPIPLDADRKATFASNLMTVMVSDQPTSPVVNVSTLTR